MNLLTLFAKFVDERGQGRCSLLSCKSFLFFLSFFYGPKFFFDPITSADVMLTPPAAFVDIFPITVDVIADKIL